MSVRGAVIGAGVMIDLAGMPPLYGRGTVDRKRQGTTP